MHILAKMVRHAFCRGMPFRPGLWKTTTSVIQRRGVSQKTTTLPCTNMAPDRGGGKLSSTYPRTNAHVSGWKGNLNTGEIRILVSQKLDKRVLSDPTTHRRDTHLGPKERWFCPPPPPKKKERRGPQPSLWAQKEKRRCLKAPNQKLG